MVTASIKISNKTKNGLKRLIKNDYPDCFKSVKSYCVDVIKDYIQGQKYKSLSITKEDIIIDKANPFLIDMDIELYKKLKEVLEKEIRDLNLLVHIILTDFVKKRGEFK
jgi:hypothetical protein